MSGFKIHRGFNYLLFVIGCLALNYFNLFNVPVMIAFGIGFIIGTEFITPDLDFHFSSSSLYYYIGHKA
jgi:uncharacterized metal-binding protein